MTVDELIEFERVTYRDLHVIETATVRPGVVVVTYWTQSAVPGGVKMEYLRQYRLAVAARGKMRSSVIIESRWRDKP